MEHITEPWQVVFLGVAGLVFAVVLVVWLRTGIDPDSEPVEFEPRTLVADAWIALLHWRPNMSSHQERDRGYPQVQNRQNSPVSLDEINPETAETPQLDAETRNELITFGENAAIARLVASGAIGLTEGVKIGAAAKSGEKYQKRTRQIKQEVEKLKEPEYPALAASKRPSIVENM